jgi:hypothetical protein
LNRLTVRLLEARAGTLTAELLGLATTVVGNEEGTVELDKGLLEEVLGVLVDELLVVGDEGLGDSLSDSINLGNLSTATHADPDVHIGELVEANDEKRLIDLESQDLGLDELEGTSVDLNETAASLAVGNGGGGLLLAKALDGVAGRHDCGCRDAGG